MKPLLSFIVFLMSICSLNAQNRLIYASYHQGSQNGDTTYIEVMHHKQQIRIKNINNNIINPIPGLSTDLVYVDYSIDSLFSQVSYPDENFFTAMRLHNERVTFTDEGKEKVNGYQCKKYRTSINSNTIEVWMTDKLGFDATAQPGLGYLPGVMVKSVRNGSSVTELKEIERQHDKDITIIPNKLGTRCTPQTLSQIKKEKLVITIPIFKEEQIHFANIDKFEGQIPFDSTIHFASGTVILKRLKLQQLPPHYQVFAEIHQKSNGDAYDRSASVFVIPTDKAITLANALIKGKEILPIVKGKDGEEYQGIKKEHDYDPAIELVRFFTPFGVGHYNERFSMEGMDWSEEAYYKQDITDLAHLLDDDVIIGAFIGNYDGGGHIISIDLRAYPGDYEWICSDKKKSMPLFNTCNVMEMAGQNYGKIFGTDTLTVEFEVTEEMHNLSLRYISTGHGGWGGGDEFNPKENIIMIDGKPCFTHTPWRCDCATYRELNPVSGNFWNGLTSSDYSRSGWCPGTATQPVYFNIDYLNPGKHTISIAIPQGPNEGGSFSHWMVSGVLLYEVR